MKLRKKTTTAPKKPSKPALSQDTQRALEQVQTEFMRLTHAVDAVKRRPTTQRLYLVSQILNAAYTCIDITGD